LGVSRGRGAEEFDTANGQRLAGWLSAERRSFGQILFGRGQQLKGHEMTFDQFAKVASMAGTILVGAGAAYTYYDTANRDLQKSFNDTQLNLCKEAADTAATLAAVAPQPPTVAADGKFDDPWHLARARFEQLYWGSLSIVESTDVENTMVLFRRLLVDNEEQIRAGKLNTGTQAMAQQDALAISHACRALVSKTWQLSLPKLTGKS